MYSRIVVPLDGSQLSEQVLPYVEYLASSLGASVVLLNVIDTEDLPEALVADLRQDSRDYLERIARTLSEATHTVCAVETGEAAEIIIRTADSQDGTLVLMATHGYSGLQQWFLGSIANKVTQAVGSPILLIPAQLEAPSSEGQIFESIIVPLDGSPLAEQILPFATSICRALKAELLIVRAYHPQFPGATIRMREVSQIVHDAAENYVSEMVQRLQQEGIEKVSYKVLRGVPAEQITDFALAIPNSLTTMCTHGRHGIGRWVFGSVTDAVIHCSQEPVLVIRPQQDDQAP